MTDTLAAILVLLAAAGGAVTGAAGLALALAYEALKRKRPQQ
jgi:hypothetical protein